ncbi:MAG: hypothetical protein D6815_05130 [Candidatus Dadabacteria bacterium]|nr:MAG: hypothetical protein D6815_05130 [Candidatus Dadabacteria bacterium]
MESGGRNPRGARSHREMKNPTTDTPVAPCGRPSGQRGAAVLEVAVMLPLLLLLLLGAIDLGRAAADALTIQSAAQAGAQYGAQDTLHAKDVAGIRKAVMEDLGDSSAAQSAKIKIERYCNCLGENGTVDCDTGTCADPSQTPRMYVRVSVRHNFKTLLKYPGLPHRVPLKQTAIMRAR